MEPRHGLFKNLLRDLKGAYVEIGTCWGGFANFLLSETPVTQLTCVDPYRHWPDEVYADSLNNYSDEQNDEKYLRVYGRLVSAFGTRVSMLRAPSTEAAKVFANSSLAFIYIDANHDFLHATQDIMAWIPKLAPGGIIAGDDVEDGTAPHDANGNLKISHAGGATGMYGVYTALAQLKKQNPWFNYTIEGNQWYWKRPAAAA
jgi:hypothetical protein